MYKGSRNAHVTYNSALGDTIAPQSLLPFFLNLRISVTKINVLLGTLSTNTKIKILKTNLQTLRASFEPTVQNLLVGVTFVGDTSSVNCDNVDTKNRASENKTEKINTKSLALNSQLRLFSNYSQLKIRQ